MKAADIGLVGLAVMGENLECDPGRGRIYLQIACY